MWGGGRVLVAAWFALAASAWATAAAGGPSAPRLAASIPRHADEPLWLDEEISGARVGVALVGAAPALAHGASPVVYARAFGDADLVRMVGVAGVEDFLRFPHRPAREKVVYRLDL